MFTDKIGREVKPGDRIAYAQREGNVGALNLGTVQEITTRKIGYNGRELPAVRWVRDGCSGKGTLITNAKDMLVINEIFQQS